MRDNLHNQALRIAIAPPATAVADNSAMVGLWIDRLGFESLTFGILTGNLADTDATFAVQVEHANAADQSDVAVVPDDGLISQTDGVLPKVAAGFTAANDNVTRKIGYVGHKRFVRVTITPAANSAAAPLAVVAILGDAATRPVA